MAEAAAKETLRRTVELEVEPGKLRFAEPPQTEKPPFDRAVAAVTKLGAAMSPALTAAALLVGIVQFTKQQTLQQTQFAEQQKQQLDVRREEIRKSYWDEQRTVFEEGAKASSKIAAAEKVGEVDAAVKEFRALYHGQMSMVETPEVERAMIVFEEQIRIWEKTAERPPGISRAANELQHCFRQALEATWSVSGGVLQNACPYKCMSFGECETINPVH